MQHPKKTRLLISLLAFAALALSPFIMPVQALAGESLVNSEVQVDVSGKDAADAREQAMTKAQLDGLTDLLSKLTSPEQVRVILSGLEPAKISSMVRSTEVLDEKISSNRYRATLMLTYDGDEISGLIDNGGGAATAPGQPKQAAAVGSFLIVPGYEEDGVQMLWEEGNPWRSACKAVGLEVASGDIVVPFGDSADAAVIDSKTLGSANYATLLPLTVRYGVSDIVIVQAKYTHTPDPQLEVIKRRVNRTQNEVNVLSYRADPQETKETLMMRAARDIAGQIEHKKNEEMETVKAVQGGDRNTVMMLASITTLNSWTELRTKMSALPMIDRLEVLAISPQQVDLIVHFRGTPESLANALTAQNIRLQQNPNYWVVSRD